MICHGGEYEPASCATLMYYINTTFLATAVTLVFVV